MIAEKRKLFFSFLQDNCRALFENALRSLSLRATIFASLVVIVYCITQHFCHKDLLLM